MISNIIPRIRMHQRAQRPPPNHQPRHKGPKLRRREDIHLKHPDRVRAYGSLEQRVDSQFGEFPPDPLVQFARVGYLCGRSLLEVDVDVEAAPRAVCYGVGEGGVGRGFCCWGRVGEGFGVWAGGFLGAGSKGWLVGCFVSLAGLGEERLVLRWERWEVLVAFEGGWICVEAWVGHCLVVEGDVNGKGCAFECSLFCRAECFPRFLRSNDRIDSLVKAGKPC